MENFTNFMIDIETLSLNPSGVILSVGICAFSPEGIARDKFYMNLNVQEQLDAGRVVDAGTISFWLKQNDEARSAFLSKRTYTSPEFLEAINEYITRFCTVSEAVVWCNGANFDFPFLEDYARTFKGCMPWVYYNTRCFRTFAAMTKCKKLSDPQTDKAHHNAVDDAIWQASTMVNYMQKKDKK